MEKKIKILIMIVIILIIATIIVILVIRNNKVENEDVLNPDVEVEAISDDIINGVDDVEFMRVDNCIAKYMSALNTEDVLYYGKNEDEEYVKLFDDNFIKNKVINLLDSRYIEENSITVENIDKYIEFSTKDREYTITEIKKMGITNPVQYIVSGFTSEDGRFLKQEKYSVKTDTAKTIFSIEPIDEERENIDEIEENTNNRVTSISYDRESTCKFYFKLIKNMLLYSVDDAYNALDEEYAKKRFTDKEGLQKYMQDNREYIEKLYLTRYKVESINEDTEYVLVDQYNNFYIINAKMNHGYTVKLDTYTIETENFKTEYEKGNDQKRVQMNIDKFILMINNQDYTAAYNLLYPEFRQRYFDTEEKFVEYVKKYMYRYNGIQFQNFETHEDTHMCEVILTDISPYPQEDTISLNFAIQLREGTDFVLSFEVIQ